MWQELFRRKSVAQIETEAASGLTDAHGTGGMNKVLTVRDLTFMGIAAIVGAGIFSTIGTASFQGGPGVIFLFLFVSVACGFSAVCYAEFASMVPVSGSAYTYSYVAFGEVVAWIIGWDLLMEYAIGNIAVAISWSDYFTTLLDGLGMHIPKFLTMDYWTAKDGYKLVDEVVRIASFGKSIGAAGMNKLTAVWAHSFAGAAPLQQFALQNGYASFMQHVSGAHNVQQVLALSGIDDAVKTNCTAYSGAPSFGALKLICDLPAFLITVVITWIIYIGIKESKRMMNGMVILKMVVIVLVIIVGACYVKPENWSPFLPNGIGGVLGGTAAVFFSYIGFDAISTTAEECRNPQRDLPKGMFNSLIICTIIYVLIALVLTGMISYRELNVGDPLAHVFQKLNLDWIAGIVSVSAVIATASVLLVFQLGQPRIWMSMSRDGLLPPIFSRIHPKYKTPSFSTVLTGFVVGIPALFMNLNDVVALTSVGTLFAFVLVCGGILVLQERRKKATHLGATDVLHVQGVDEKVPVSKFKTPYVNGRWIVPLLFIAGVILFVKFYPDGIGKSLNCYDEDGKFSWEIMRGKVPYVLFALVFAVTAVVSFLRSLSLIPVLGFLCCTYLLCESGTTNWERFLIWLIIGLCLYFVYGKQHSKLRNKLVQ